MNILSYPQIFLVLNIVKYSVKGVKNCCSALKSNAEKTGLVFKTPNLGV